MSLQLGAVQLGALLLGLLLDQLDSLDTVQEVQTRVGVLDVLNANVDSFLHDAVSVKHAPVSWTKCLAPAFGRTEAPLT